MYSGSRKDWLGANTILLIFIFDRTRGSRYLDRLCYLLPQFGQRSVRKQFSHCGRRAMHVCRPKRTH